MRLYIYLLGQFKLTTGDQDIELSSRPAQSLFAYLALNAGLSQRRERLSGQLWPDASDTNARSYLRQALWRIRKSLANASLNAQDYFQISDINVAFNDQSDYWLDTKLILDDSKDQPTKELIEAVGLYKEELLPGFYDEWVIPERDRLQAAYHHKMNLLLERLILSREWDQALQWSEKWILLGNKPDNVSEQQNLTLRNQYS